MADSSAGPTFLMGGGEMGALIRAHDWSASSLGPPETWPQPLRTAVRLLLNTGHPMYIWWGPELLCFYNDAYRASIGPERHPGSLGRPGREVWDEIWPIIGPQIEQVMSGGGATWHENALVPITRNGRREDVYWTYSYGPIDDEAASTGVGGVLVVCTETTQQVMAEQHARAERERLGQMFEQAPGFITMLEGPEHRFALTNAAYRTLIGGRDVVGKTAREALPEVAGQGFFELLDRVFASGEPFRGAATPIRLVREPDQPAEERVLDFVYQPVMGSEGQVSGIFVEGSDVTEAYGAQAALRESEARYRQIVEGAEDLAIITLDEHGTITGWNTGAQRLTGISDEEAIGQPGAIIFTPEDREAGGPDHEMNRTKSDGRAVDERWHQRKDATRFWGSGLMMRMDQPGGGYLKIFRDRTSEHAAEAALRESEERYRTLFNTIEAGFCVLEVIFDEAQRPVDYRFIEANPAFERQSGLVNAVGRTARELVPHLEQHWFDIYGQVALTGEPVRFENGAEPMGRWFEVRALRVGDPEARRVAILFNDITERRRTDERLRELNETLEQQVAERTADRDRMWRLSTDIMLVARFDGTIGAINPAWERLLGWSEGELLGRSFLDFVHPDDLETTQAEAGKLSEGVTTSRFENRYRAKDGAYSWISWIAVPEEGLIHAVGRNITAEKEREAELEQAQEALRQSQKMEAVGQLTGGVAHDFNNLLTIIRSSTGLLRRPDLAEERRRIYMDAITDTVDRAARLTGQLLAFARRQTLKPEVFDVAERIRALDDMLRTLLGARIGVVTDIACDPCPVEADVSQFETAMVNMAVNARDAMEGEGMLTVRVDSVPDHRSARKHKSNSPKLIAIALTDTGSGIPSEHLARIFEPFFTTKEVGKGTGLGLSQVFGFAKQSGGDVSVDSKVGHGTTFTLYLPHANEAEIPVADVTSAPTPVEDGGGRRVLVVEDNVDVGTFSTQVLNDLGYETTWVVNAQEALTYLKEQSGRFDVVFTDVVMPGMSGVELGEEIRRRYPGLPVVLTSGYSHVLVQEGQHGFELLKKPYAAEDLSRLLRRVSSRRGA